MVIPYETKAQEQNVFALLKSQIVSVAKRVTSLSEKEIQLENHY